MKEPIEFKEIFMLGQCLSNGKMMPAAKMIANEHPFKFSALDVAAWCITTLNCFEFAVAPEKREEFFESFKDCFDKMMEARKKYSKQITPDNVSI